MVSIRMVNFLVRISFPVIHIGKYHANTMDRTPYDCPYNNCCKKIRTGRSFLSPNRLAFVHMPWYLNFANT